MMINEKELLAEEKLKDVKDCLVDGYVIKNQDSEIEDLVVECQESDENYKNRMSEYLRRLTDVSKDKR